MRSLIFFFLLTLFASSCTVSAQETPTPEPTYAVNVVVSKYVTIGCTETVTAIFNPSRQVLTVYESECSAGEPFFTYDGPARIFMLNAETLTAETPRGNVNLCLFTGEIQILLDGRADTYCKYTPGAYTSR